MNSGATGQAAGVLEAANEQLGKAYKLGADGTWATDCGKLFSDAVKQSLGADVPRRVVKLWEVAAAVGAWHPEGDGYIPKAGDGVVVLVMNTLLLVTGTEAILVLIQPEWSLSHLLPLILDKLLDILTQLSMQVLHQTPLLILSAVQKMLRN